MNRFHLTQLIWVVLLVTLSTISAQEQQPQCPSQIYCYGPLLHTVQMGRINNDSKTFVDMKLKQNEAMTLLNFQAWSLANPSPTTEDIRAFVEANFDPEGSEFEDWIPDDYIENPEIFDHIVDYNYREFAHDLNDLWLVLGRKMIDDVHINPHLYSIIPVPNPVIVPGGRFREFYYWDSYWIILGLLTSEMNVTAKGMLENFLTIVEGHGFIPNGGRIYYEGRSQPPLLIPMFHEYFNATNDLEFIRSSIDTLEKEFLFWINNKMITINGHAVAIYGDNTRGPRPESYYEDVETASHLESEESQNEFYSELKCAAESGMDFSSRWFILAGTNSGTLRDLQCHSIVPVELNAILYWNANILADFYSRLGNEMKMIEYQDRSHQIFEAVQAIFWHEDIGAWLDWDLLNNHRRDHFVPTNLSPLWTHCYDQNDRENLTAKVMGYIAREGVHEHPGGVPNTLEHTGEQWDFPNAWAPMQHMLIVGLNDLQTQNATDMAIEWASRWVHTNYIAFIRTQFMFEKYSAIEIGVGGDGGEYDVQVGFGWSNGAVLDLLKRYGDKLSSGGSASIAFGVIATTLTAIIVLAAGKLT